MKALVLGAGGQLGGDVAAGAPAGVEVTALDVGELDLRDGPCVQAFLRERRFDVVVNAAAYVNVDGAEDQAAEAFAVNATAVRDLAAGCAASESVLVHISTDYVFGGGRRSHGRPYVESDPVAPLNTYGVSKAAGELLLQATWTQHYLIRVAGLFGRRGAAGKGNNFVTAILKQAHAGKALRVIDDVFVSPTYTVDAAQQLWRLVTEQRPFGTYHVTNAGVTTWFEFARRIAAAAGLAPAMEAVPHTAYPARAQRPLWSPLASEKGVQCRPWQEAVDEYVKWLEG